MSDTSGNDLEQNLTIRHTGRLTQIGIYFGKFIRMFVYQSDWVMLPMAALIAGLVGFALGSDFRVTMEGTLTGAFAIVCVCIWNGCFNSIQVICRERDVIKREHRSGLHVSSYIVAHMLYQLILCVLQTVVTVLTFWLVGMDFSGDGLFSAWLILDIGITMLLVTYASDMMSLFISSLVHSTTTAMTIMPFVLIFQLVFSGGLFALPSVVTPIEYLTISHPGLKAMSAQVQVNSLPSDSVTDMLDLVEEVEFDVTITGADIIGFIADDNSESNKELREIPVNGGVTVREVTDTLLKEDTFSDLRKKTLINRISVGEGLDALSNSNNSSVAELKAIPVGGSVTVRDLLNMILTDDSYAQIRDSSVIEGISIGQLLSMIMNTNGADSILNTEIGMKTTVGEVIDYIRTDSSFGDVRSKTLIDTTSVGEGLKILNDSGADILNTEIEYNTTLGEVCDYLNQNGALEQYRDERFTYHAKLKDVIDKVGRDETIQKIKDKASEEMYKKDYEYSAMNILMNWLHILIFIIVFSVGSIISLEFIDKDKR